MAQVHYSYRFGAPVPLLDESEWAKIEPLVYSKDRLSGVILLRKKTGMSLRDALKSEPIGFKAVEEYNRMTGAEFDHVEALYHVRARNYGSICPACKKPFRTPRAKLCAECGYQLPTGQIAGPLEI